MKLTNAELEFYAENGYLVLSQLFTAEEIAEINKLAREIAEESKQFVVEGPAEKASDIRGTKVFLANHNGSQQAINRVVWAAAAKPALLTHGRNLKLLDVVSQLLYSDQADHLINQLHYKIPGDGVAFLWHQDEQNRLRFDPAWQSDVTLNGSFVQTLTAIDPSTKDNGPLNVIPGSHTWGFLNFGGFLATDKLQSHLESKGIDVTVTEVQTPLIMEPGQVAFMHPRLVHASWPNTSTQSRLMFLNGFSSPGANHKPYPGEGSAKRISLRTGKELAEKNPLINNLRTIATSTFALLPPPASNEKQAPVSNDNPIQEVRHGFGK